MALDIQETEAPLSEHEAEIAGLDALDIPIATAKGRFARVWEGLWPKLAALALFFLGWQIIVWSHWKPEYVLPGPVTALKAMWHAAFDVTPNGSHILLNATVNTMKRAAIGYAISVVLGVAGTARLTRVMRANLLDELNKPYVTTARAKGLSEWRLVVRYPARLALNPLVSTIGWYLPALFSGSLIVATVMNLPNIGPLLLRALINQDMYLAGSFILMLSVLTVIGTLISDILLAWLDPRIKFE